MRAFAVLRLRSQSVERCLSLFAIAANKSRGTREASQLASWNINLQIFFRFVLCGSGLPKYKSVRIHLVPQLAFPNSGLRQSIPATRAFVTQRVLDPRHNFLTKLSILEVWQLNRHGHR